MTRLVPESPWVQEDLVLAEQLAVEWVVPAQLSLAWLVLLAEWEHPELA